MMLKIPREDDLRLDTEEWKAVVGYPIYEVSSLGRIRSLGRTHQRPNRTETGVHSVQRRTRIISGYLKRRPNGQPVAMVVTLRRDAKTYYERIHRLVLGAFIGQCPPGLEGCHGDGDPSNNALSNLRWDTHIANVADSVTHGRKTDPPVHSGETHPNATLTDDQVRSIRATPIQRGTKAELARQYGVAPITIQRLLDGTSRSA